jgi:hypothetical protein
VTRALVGGDAERPGATLEAAGQSVAAIARSIVARQCGAAFMFNRFRETYHVEYRPPHS